MNLTTIKNELVSFAPLVNAFQTEAVQVKVIDAVLDVLLGINKKPIGHRLAQVRTNARLNMALDDDKVLEVVTRKPIGATKVLNQVLNTDYFNERRTIGDIQSHCRNVYAVDFKTSELSGILLKLANQGKLIRVRSNENNRFEYVTFLAK